jgi:hypothetical protein
MQKEKQLHQDSMRYPISEYSNPELEKKGLSFKQPDGYRDKWDTLPK